MPDTFVTLNSYGNWLGNAGRDIMNGTAMAWNQAGACRMVGIWMGYRAGDATGPLQRFLARAAGGVAQRWKLEYNVGCVSGYGAG